MPHPERMRGPGRRTRVPEKALGVRPSYPCRLMTSRQIPPVEAGGTKKPCTREERRRKATLEGDAGASKKGKVSLPNYSATAAHIEEGWLPRGKPPVRS